MCIVQSVYIVSIGIMGIEIGFYLGEICLKGFISFFFIICIEDDMFDIVGKKGFDRVDNYRFFINFYKIFGYKFGIMFEVGIKIGSYDYCCFNYEFQRELI